VQGFQQHDYFHFYLIFCSIFIVFYYSSPRMYLQTMSDQSVLAFMSVLITVRVTSLLALVEKPARWPVFYKRRAASHGRSLTRSSTSW
jgi:hypothetical protein